MTSYCLTYNYFPDNMTMHCNNQLLCFSSLLNTRCIDRLNHCELELKKNQSFFLRFSLQLLPNKMQCCEILHFNSFFVFSSSLAYSMSVVVWCFWFSGAINYFYQSCIVTRQHVDPSFHLYTFFFVHFSIAVNMTMELFLLQYLVFINRRENCHVKLWEKL